VLPASIGLWHGAVAGNVADATSAIDVDVKAAVYGRSGFPTYWVVHRAGVEVFTDPSESGYRQQQSVPAAGTVQVPYRRDVSLPVADLLDAEQ
jgi:hypothetical protein